VIAIYIKIATRAMSKNKLISFINLFGLGLAMSVGMMIMIRLQDQLNYDKFHPYPKHTYRITSNYEKLKGEQWELASTPLPLRDALQADHADIAHVVSIYPALKGKAIVAGKELHINGAFTQPSFFRVFGFRLISGNEATALEQPFSLVISKRTAEKFFGNSNPIGQTLKLEGKGDYIITGVLEDAPGKSHLTFDAYASYSSVAGLEKNKLLQERSDGWYSFDAAYTYAVVKKGINKSALQNDLRAVSNDLNKANKDGTASFDIQRLDKITPGTDRLANDIGSGSGWTKLFTEIGIALLILMAACFNYTNLTIGRALTRAKEVGIRKINGAKRYQVFSQYIVEALMTALMALTFAWLLLSFIIRYAPFNDGYEFIPSSTTYNPSLIIGSICFALFTGIVAGVVPAWILSSFQPLRVLKNMTTAKIFGKVSIQKTLIVFQYSLSLVIIIFLSAFYRQFAFMADADPGFQKENVLVADMRGINQKIATHELSLVNGVQHIAGLSARLDGRFSGMKAPMWLTTQKDALSLNYYYADENFIPAMQIPFVAGRNFPASSNDTIEQYIILNEKAVLALGIKNVADAPGQKLWTSDSTNLEIAGVVKDFNYENTGRPILPLAFRNKQSGCNYLYIHTDNTDRALLQKRVTESWGKFAGSQPPAIFWLDESLAEGNSQTATISLLGYLAFIALSISTLGLLGLVIYSIEVRRKEISIRKIIGASEKQLVNMLSKKFIRLLVISGLIAMPIGYTAAVLFLQNFTNRVSFGVFSVLLCFIVLLSIGLATIISQTYNAAIANPANNLRTE
jgi:putative ABC transport system permease protein